MRFCLIIFSRGYFEVDVDVNVDVDNYVDAVVSVVVDMLYYHLSGRRETSQQKNGYWSLKKDEIQEEGGNKQFII